MKMSALHAPTLKEAPKEAEIPSHALMIRAGYIRKVAAGVYSFGPLGARVYNKIAGIVRQEMDRAGAQEVMLPTIQPAELWKESGRWDKYGPELLRMKDRKDNEFCYSPTAEEMIVDLVRNDIRSWRQLPVNLYQIGRKFRDEIRPRAGLMRGREFVMKDAYSFDTDEEAASKTYDAMFNAYHRIFERCGLAFKPVEADSGAIGGSRSHEFQVLAETGEDRIVSCQKCGYTANVEKAELGGPPADAPLTNKGEGTAEIVSTPGTKTIEDVAALLKCKKKQVLKAVLFNTDKGDVMALVRGDQDVNEFKVKDAIGATRIEVRTTRRDSGADVPFGYIGPIGAPSDVTVLADHSVRGMADFVCGANAADQHYINVNALDLGVTATHDLRFAENNDRCGRCGGKFKAFRGIEVGHVFFLGTKYSEPMKCTFLDAEGQERPMVMGCYGIGLTRIMAAAIEQNHDKWGIAWPVPIAPYEVAVLPLNGDDADVVSTAGRLYDELLAAGIQAVLDDRELRPGAKFNDADLMGFPYQLVVGNRGLADGKVEIKERKTNNKQLLDLADAITAVVQQVTAART